MSLKEIKKMKASKTLSGRFSPLRVVLIGALAFVVLMAMSATASATAPAWKLTVTSSPTHFAPGSVPGGESSFPEYYLVASNTGSKTSSAPATITDTLPAGVTPVKVDGRVFYPPFSPLSCEILGQTVSCEVGAVPPGRNAEVNISVKVDADAPASVQNEASIVGGGAGEAVARTTTAIDSAIAPFDFSFGTAGLSYAVTAVDGNPATQAGSHPGQMTIDTGFPTAVGTSDGQGGTFVAGAGHLRNLQVHLPRGMVVNPTATPALCTEIQLTNDLCPDASAVGLAVVQTSLGSLLDFSSALYNMVPPPGVAAQFGFDALGAGIFIHIQGGVNTAGEYELFAGAHDAVARPNNPVFGVQTLFWGNPSDPSHDPSRGHCLAQESGTPSCPAVPQSIPMLTMPSSCSPTATATAVAESWDTPGQAIGKSVLAEDQSNGSPVGTDGCNTLEFKPTIEAKPTTNLADSPSGLEFKLHIPQEESIEGRAEANLKDATVTLPPGMVVNPSGANGLGACSAAQFGLTSGIGQSPIRTNAAPATCPDSAKIGSLEVDTQLLDHPLQGAIYAAKPYENPFDSLLAIYLVVNDEQSGTVIKLAGKAQADPQSGQLTTTFTENPEVPFEDFKLNFYKGPRAVLKTPPACATYTTTSDLTPWSTPEGVNERPSDSFATTVTPNGGPCPTSEAAAPNNPSFSAGAVAPQAGAYSPFVLKLSREDGSQRFSGLNTTLPKGLIGKLAGVPYCPEAAIAQAQSRSHPNEGAIEQANPSCPAASEVGTVKVGAGAGITPFYAQGHAYLAGPYKGAPLSVVFVTPAVAGPYDLGAVTVRAALKVDPETAQVTAVSDPFPQILEGIPLDIRSVEVKLSRPDFTLNPTSCDPMAVTGSAFSTLGSAASLTSPFQVGGCASLGFKPKLAFSLKGPTKRTGHPSLKATVTYPKGAYANIAKAQVTLPKSEFLDQAHIQTICTRVQFAADQCPAGAVYGFAKATTPLLDAPVSGPVYLRSSSHELPDLVADLNGQINIVLAGRVDTVGKGIRTTFETVPDAPITKFTLEMKGGKKGLLINSTNLCKQTNRATALFDAQNGKTYDAKPVMVVSCKGKGRKRGKGKGDR